MDKRDLIGKRGQSIFEVKISTWCAGAPLFNPTNLGEKFELHDYMVEVLDPPAQKPFFFAQVKSCDGRYRGKKKNRKIAINISKDAVRALKECGRLSYIVGVEIQTEKAYILGVTSTMPDSVTGIRVSNQITRTTLKMLKKEVLAAWAANHRILPASVFV